jgi:membrane protease subunit (stomatin/prohibitin family)
MLGFMASVEHTGQTQKGQAQTDSLQKSLQRECMSVCSQWLKPCVYTGWME